MGGSLKYSVDLRHFEAFKDAVRWCEDWEKSIPKSERKKYHWSIFGVHTGQFDYGKTTFSFRSSHMAAQFKLMDF